MAATNIARPMKGACSMTIEALRFYGYAISVIAMSRKYLANKRRFLVMVLEASNAQLTELLFCITKELDQRLEEGRTSMTFKVIAKDYVDES